jgi:RNA polymerase sigma factor (sigma-70 family)
MDELGLGHARIIRALPVTDRREADIHALNVSRIAARHSEVAPERVFAALYEANFSRILGYTVRRTQTPEDAADAAAETFLIAWRRLEQVPEGDGARLWLYGTARRVLANQRRSDARRTRLSERLRAELEVAAEAREEDSAEVELIRAAMSRLGQKDRELLGLVAWEGLGPAEIATVLGCSRNAAKLRTHRARKRLAREIAVLERKPLAGGGHSSHAGNAPASVPEAREAR